MIDYRGHAVILEQLRQSLAAASFLDPALAAKQAQTLADVATSGDYALLGAFVDQLMAHAASDGTEISLLERAADLWKKGVDLCNTLGSIRKDLEAALDNPTDPASPAKFNSAAMTAQQWATTLSDMHAEIVALQTDVDPLPHLPPHPRQQDKASSAWDWSNLTLGRRTDAFVRNVAKQSGNTTTRAFAFGVLASYGGNAAGSAYLGHAVGGPRRAHRYRDRLARNASGSWLGAHHSGIGTLTGMSQQIRFGHPAHPSLPPQILTQLTKALAATFDETHTQPVPDLGLGYRRLLKHLLLLDQFVMPPVPSLPSGGWVVKLYGDPTSPPPTLRPQDVGVSGDPGGGVSVGVGSNQPGSTEPGQDDSKKSSGSICGAIIALLILIAILLVVAFIECVIQWAKGNKCNYFETLGDLITGLFKKGPPDPRDPPKQEDPQMTSSGLTAFASTEQAAQLVAYFHELHVQVWEGLNNAYNYLAITGLIYPDGLLNLPRFKQFVKLPAATSWPHRPEKKPDETYHLFPSSLLEKPLATASPYGTFATPEAFAGLGATAVQIALPLWEQIFRDVQDSNNLDLDADRGIHHPCWATRGSINKDPLDVVILKFTDQ